MSLLSRNAWPYFLASLVLTCLALAACLYSSLDTESYVTLSASLDGETSDENLGFYTADLRLEGSEACTDIMHFDGENIGVLLNCQLEDAGREGEGDLTVELHRVRLGLIDEYVSSKSMSQNGRSEASWENVGPGDYYFKVEKPNDGQTVRSALSYIYGF